MKKYFFLLTITVALGGFATLAQKALMPRSESPSQAIWSMTDTRQVQTPDNRFAVTESHRSATRAADVQEVLLDQDFSLITEGSEAEPVPISLVSGSFTSVDDLMISSEYMGSEGWWGVGVYAADHQIALAIPSYGGVINTPLMDLYGNITINIRAKNMEANGGSSFFWLTCQKPTDGNLLAGTVVNTLPTGQGGATNMCKLEGDDWHEFSIQVLNPCEEETWFQINGTTYSKGGILIDKIEIVRDNDFAMAPTNLLSYDFTDEGFTARWEPGANNHSYLLTLVEQSEDGEPQELALDFDNIRVDDNGNITSLSDLKGVEVSLVDNKGTINEGFDETGAIVLTSDNDYILLPDLGSPIVGGSVYVKANVDPNANVLIYISGERNGGFTLLGSLPLNQALAGKEFILSNYIIGLENYTSLQFQPFGLSDGENLIVDNLRWSVSAPLKETTVFEDKPFDSNVVVLTGLNPVNEYFFSVKGVSEHGAVSSPSQFKHAIGCPAPKVTGATDLNSEKGTFTANWEPSIKAQAYEVSYYELRDMTEDIEEYSVFYDDFENASDPEGYGIELDGTSFNGLADNNGWTSEIGIYSESSIGAYYGADLASPYLSLGNDNGKFKIKTQISGFPGTDIILQCNITSFQVATIPMEGNSDELISEEFEFTFEDGTELTQLLFYTHSLDPFLLQDIEVFQNVSKGDFVLSFKDSKMVNGHDTTSCEFTGLMPSDDYDYAYTVTAYGTYLGIGYNSIPSAVAPVRFGKNSIASVSDSEKIQMFVRNGSLYVSLPADAVINIYDLMGNKVSETKGLRGINTVPLEVGGVYIVRINEKSGKIYVK